MTRTTRKQLNLKTSFDYKRVFNESRVLRSPDHGGELRIAYRQKIRQNLEELFHQRAAFHQKAYQHKDTKIIELMILDGLNSANSEEKFVYGPDTGKWYNLSSAHKDISAFLKLTDAIFELICNWGKGGVQAETIFGNIVHRNLYKFLGFKELTDALAEHNVVLVSTHIDYGSGSENPLNSAIFYCKDNGRDSVRAVKAKNFPMPLLEKKGFLLLRHSIPEIDENNNNEVNETDITSTVEEVEKICGNFKLELQQE
ncbi:Deoxynucleoside triphosphate triphosphohydrolase SAMHD1 [Folsomia candida]|uniref:Deoxynucleoside triphosphate triphosphohydrolase SAMHD1 n=1 Tax=Folsomia candida TaxID=158441 RepID=A0A226EAX5_FOLCA|nr:Deoxynucleoside triphosphate triphosphohydrolase SAMHD1 [Folsomia candida]